jgi:cytochrome c6
MINKNKNFVLGVFFLLVFFVCPANAGDPFVGKGIYDQHCTSCHGADGRGIMVGTTGDKSFTAGSTILVKPDGELKTFIRNGKGIMPAYRGILTEEQILDVIAHIRTFF